MLFVDWWQEPQRSVSMEYGQRLDGEAATKKEKNKSTYFRRFARWHLSIWPEISIHIGFTATEIYIVKSFILWKFAFATQTQIPTKVLTESKCLSLFPQIQHIWTDKRPGTSHLFCTLHQKTVLVNKHFRHCRCHCHACLPACLLCNQTKIYFMIGNVTSRSVVILWWNIWCYTTEMPTQSRWKRILLQ